TLSPLTQEKLRPNCRSIRFVGLPGSRSAVQAFPNDIRSALGNIIENRQRLAQWWPAWNWGMYEDVWPIAKKEWAGRITVDVLHTLKKFGRLKE
ncbi:MAG: hypothetical protein HC806_09965, partial [Anaerolineae bacterium]|nr:hypothetical protein [Anaerolineae bacterium]